jgi:hypothetical protein
LGNHKHIIETLAMKVPMPTRKEYEVCHRRRYELLGIEFVGPLPEHGLYELPANFLDTFKRAPARSEASCHQP